MTEKPLKQYTDAELEAIRHETLKHDEAGPRARTVHYDAARGFLVLELKNQVRIEIPIHLIEGLAGASAAQLEKVEMDSRGYALNWEELDVQMSVEGLVSGVFGSRRWMQKLASELGRKGGKVSTPAKRVAVRENGKLGGRPRKKALA